MKESFERRPQVEDMLKGDAMRSLWEHHDRIMESAPQRSVYWGLQKAREEAEEWAVTDPVLTPEAFSAEGSNFVMAWMTTMKEAGFDYETAIEALFLTINVQIDRHSQVNEMMPNGKSWDANYQTVKKREKLDK